MTRSLLPVLLLPLFLAASAARADIPPRAPASVALYLAGVFASAAPDAPSEDVSRIEGDVRGQMYSAQRRIDRCLGSFNLREDPLRSRARRMELRLRFARSGRPNRVWIATNTGVPSVAQQCVLEAARSISVRPAPRGNVLVRVAYELR
jgi:hypothetical protein